ncbi:rhomboid-domain-containing protein [Amylocystis lapponica]|nr:rhomboid-domain-containing protein [Amylocystis lapponica]
MGYGIFGLYPLEQRIADKQRGIGVQRYAIVVWLLTATMLAVLIYELVVNARAQGSPVSALINLGARFPPCMKIVEDVPLSTTLPCLNDTANPPDRECSLETLCGFGGFHNEAPDQSFRFTAPIFLHAGIVHYALNMLAQLTVSAQVEREMGSITFLILYMASGIFGNVLGGNFALVGVPSVGASGAIFGTTAIAWVDLLAHWRYTYRPGRRLAMQIVELIIGIGLGFIPYRILEVCYGPAGGMMFYPIISPSTRHRSIVIFFRLAAIPAAVLLFVFLTRNFYTSNPYAACTWCRYLSCIPTSANDHCKGTGLTSTTTSV